MRISLLVFSALVLCALGLLFIFGVSYVRGNNYILLKKQLIAILIGIGLMFLISRTSISILRKFVFPFLLIAFLATVATLFVGSGNVRRWITFPGFSVQPSEFLKLAVVLLYARILSKLKLDEIDFYGVLLFIILGLFFGFPVLLQPDYGNFVFMSVLVFFMLFVSGVRLRYLLITLSPIIPLFAFFVISSPYRLKRILAFIDPWQDPYRSGFQVIQSMLSYTSGGLTGVGIGDGVQKLFFLPAAHTDFIISSIAEEAGFIGIIIIVVLIMIICFIGFLSALEINDRFAKLAIAGTTFNFVFQGIVNLFVTVGLFPTKGLPFPFVSYGGSSAIASFMTLGVMVSAISSSYRR